MVTLSHRLEYAGFAAYRAMVQRMSLDHGTAFAAAMARAMVPLVRRRTLRNLRLAMPELSDEAHRGIVVDMADHLARTAIEYLHLAELRDDPERITVSGVEHLQSARIAGRGAVLVTGHLGHWEMVRAACARLDWAPAIIYRKFNNALVDAEAQRLMQTLDAPIFHKGKRGTLGLLRHIRKGGAAMILSDQRFNGAPHVPFFDLPARTALAPAEIALEYGAALLPVYGIRRGRSSRFDITIDPPLLPGTSENAALETMRQVNHRLESRIRETPGQYFWLHNRWRLQDVPAHRLPPTALSK